MTVRYDIGGTAVLRQGRVIRLLGDLEPAGQMARILVEVDDPLDLSANRSIGRQGLLFDSFVDLQIEGPQVRDVIELPRAWLHNGDTVYVFGESGLEIRNVTVTWRQADAVFVTAGLAPGDRVVTSPLATPVAGMKLRLKQNGEQPLAAMDEAH